MSRPRNARLFRRGRIWWLSYWNGARRIRESSGTDNRKSADEMRRERERSMLLGTVGLHRQLNEALHDPARSEVLRALIGDTPPIELAGAVKEYLDQSATYKRPKTIAADRGRLNEFVKSVSLPHLGQVTTGAINALLVEKAKRDSCTAATLLRYREVLHAFFEWARKQGHVRTNPVTNVRRPRIPEHDIRFLTLEQIDVCLDAVQGDMLDALVATAIYGGLRREELCWLTWADVLLDSKRPLIRVRSKRIGEEAWTPKTKRNRTVPVSRDLLPYLTRQRLRAGKSVWVFPSPQGQRWDPDNLSRRLAKLMHAATLPWTFLDYRHTFGSQLAQKGVSLYKIAELMGNSPEIARRHYARLLPEQMHDEVQFDRSIARGTRLG